MVLYLLSIGVSKMAEVIITLGSGAEAAISEDGNLCISNGPRQVSLGQATPEKFTSIIKCLERLSVHAVQHTIQKS
jgi:hypothetical protein